MQSNVQIDRKDDVAVVKMNRPDKRNALNHSMVSGLIDAFNEVREEKSIRAVVLTGEGKAFSAGADLDALRKLSTASREDNLADSAHLARLFELIYRFPKVVVARVNGHAIAGGSGLASVCDFAIADEKAKFGFTEVRIGFIPAIVMVFLRQKLREADVRDLLLRGHLIDAPMAADMGLINLAVPGEVLDYAVMEFASEIAGTASSQSIAATKQMLADITGLSLEESLEVAVNRNAEARETDDCQAGIAAFLDKKTPPWVRE